MRGALVLSLLAGCATTHEAPRSVPLTFHQGVPRVEVTIEGHPAVMLVDTGSFYHLLASWLLQTAHIFSAPSGGTVHDMTGNLAELRLSALRIASGDWKLVDDGVAVMRMHNAAADGVAGLLSPQWIPRRGGAVVVDLDAGALRWMPRDEIASRYAAWTVVPLDTCLDGMYSQHIGARATVGGQAALMEIDTGAQVTVVYGSRPPGARLQQASPRDTRPVDFDVVAGTAQVVPLPIQKIVLGALAWSRRIGLLLDARSEACQYDGAIGMDLLRTCAVVFEPRRVTLRCLPPR